MGCTHIAENVQGLEQLVHTIEVRGVSALGSSWQGWLSRALHQLENDDSIEAHLADSMADALVEAEEALLDGARPDGPLLRLVALHTEARTELQWRQTASELEADQLASTTWDDLHKALDAASHSPALVESWIEWAEGEFLSLWDDYEASDVLPHEVTIESVLGHEFLSEGVDEWMTALALLRDSLDGPVDSVSILQHAQAGQRLLVTVQAIEEARRNQRENFIAAWMN